MKMPKRLKLLPLDDYRTQSIFRSLVRNSSFFDDSLRDADISIIEKKLLADGYPLDEQMQKLKENHLYGIVEYENILDDSAWEIEASEGLTVTFSQVIGGQVFHPTVHTEHGIVRIAYKADFYDACKARDRAIENSDIGEFYTVLAKGFAAVDGIINHYLEVYNRFADADNQLSERKPGGRGFLSLEQKILQLVPKMTGGTITETDAGWLQFLELKELRNKSGIHPKPGEGITTIEELADGLNKFAIGLGGLMFVLYKYFGDLIPANIIRAHWFPEVVVERYSR
ncbi:hypothetical protein ACTABX_15450 [Pseudomonas syringae]